MIVAGEHFPFDEAVEIDQIADHAGGWIDLSADRDFEGVVVAVSVRIVALAVGGEIFGGRHVGRCAAGARRRRGSGG